MCFTQLFAKKTGAWKLYVQTLTVIVPVSFSIDIQNYARWLTVRAHDRQLLEQWAPGRCACQFSNGNFMLK